MTLDRATPKQLEMLVAYIQTGSLKEAAALLKIKEQAARHRMMAMYKRTGVKNAAQAAYLMGRESRN